MLIFRDQIRICALNQIAFCISEWQAQWSPGTLRLLVCLWHKNKKKPGFRTYFSLYPRSPRCLSPLPRLDETQQPGSPRQRLARLRSPAKRGLTMSNHHHQHRHQNLHLDHQVCPAPVPAPVGRSAAPAGGARYQPTLLNILRTTDLLTRIRTNKYIGIEVEKESLVFNN